MPEHMVQCVVVRHAESTFNAAGLWQGQSDPPLSQSGRDQAEALATRLAQTRVDAVITSDLQRASQTAVAIASRHGLEPFAEAGLRELDVGGWAGLSTDGIAARYPDEWRAYREGVDVRRGGGETLGEMHARVAACFNGLLDAAHRSRQIQIVVVTHGGCARAIALDVLGLGHLTANPLPLAPPGNTALSIIASEAGGVTRLSCYNDNGHLRTTADTALG